ncbi:ribokinase [Leifsonia poae]|uniref:Ribokinase n=2 Tax=Leifsonia poae TaxID=110933 RepID=A0A9W6LZY0_9MICO|nr:ribokinase [Leifsonia poae]
METFHEEVHMARAERSTVFVFGSINADTCYRVPSLPLPGQTVLASSADASPGGKGANQAIASSCAGAPTFMIGAVGDDAEAAVMIRALNDRGVGVDGIVARRDALTGRALVLVDDEAENSIVVLPGANALLDDSVAVAELATIGAGDVLVLQNEVSAAANRAAADIARRAGAVVVWNAAPAPVAPQDLVHDIDLLVVNENELAQLAALLGVEQPRSDGADDTARLLSKTVDAIRHNGDRAVDAVCTLGADGAVYVSAEGSGRVRAPRVDAVDTTAAGDTLVGYLAAHLRLPLGERLELAGAAGALAVTRDGASSSIPALRDVERMLAATPERTSA